MTMEESVNEFPYEDIVNLQRPVSQLHKPMPMETRAAQFAPFAALDGYEEAISSATEENINGCRDNA